MFSKEKVNWISFLITYLVFLFNQQKYEFFNAEKKIFSSTKV